MGRYRGTSDAPHEEEVSGYRKLVVALFAMTACVISPAACPSIAIIAAAFFGVHGIQAWRDGNAKADTG